MISQKQKFDLQGYIENAVQCYGHGTYMCGICACAPDFFGRRCECDAENMNFGGDLVSDLTIQLFVHLSLLLQTGNAPIQKKWFGEPEPRYKFCI